MIKSFLSIFLFIILFSSCKDSSVEPKEELVSLFGEVYITEYGCDHLSLDSLLASGTPAGFELHFYPVLDDGSVADYVAYETEVVSDSKYSVDIKEGEYEIHPHGVSSIELTEEDTDWTRIEVPKSSTYEEDLYIPLISEVDAECNEPTL